MIVLKIAGLPIAIDNRYKRLELMAKDYITDEEPVFTVSVTDEEIEEERVTSGTDFSAAYYESIVAYRHIAEKLPEYDAVLFHGAVMEIGDYAYAITANSGVGKTTHVRLWLSEFGEEVKILNGDKPLLRIIDGVPYACGTPWQGKENYGRNSVKELKGIAFLSRGTENKAYSVETKSVVIDFMSQVYLPKKDRKTLSKTMLLSDKVLSAVRLVKLECNMDPEAAHVCRAALIKENN